MFGGGDPRTPPLLYESLNDGILGEKNEVVIKLIACELPIGGGSSG